MKLVTQKQMVAAKKWKPTGDGTRVGFFVRLPENLASQFPSLGDHDDSPPHITFFNIGDIPKDRQEEFTTRVKNLFLTFRGPVHASLGPIDYFVHPGKERTVAHLVVQFNKSIAQWRSRLHDLVLDMGLSVGDFNPMVYNPHVTLEYMDGLNTQFTGELPKGHWSFNSVEIWGLSKPHIIPFGLGAAVRVATHWEIMKRVASKYQDKIKTDKGNVIYQYGPRQVADRHKKKAEKLEKLKSSIGKLTSKVKRDLKSTDSKKKLTALAVALINDTYERVGNDDSADEGHFGVTGWLVDHIKFNGNGASISYVGKSGVSHTKKITDSTLTSALKDVCKDCDKGGQIFNGVGASEVNAYLKEFEITAKDLRGFHANREMCRVLKENRKNGPTLPKSRKERDKILKEEFAKSLDEVAQVVGHEKATLRSDYLVPGLEDSFMKDGTVIESYKKKTAALLPVMNPLFNFRQIVKEILLLEDHLAHPDMRCPDCINKHLLKIEGYAEEAITLGGEPELIDLADGVIRSARSFFSLFGIGVEEEEEWLDVQQVLRKTRKILLPYALRIKVATKTHAEKEEEQVEKTKHKKPKLRPPRKDLHKDRIHVDDNDMDTGDRGDDKDLSLNYKRVASLWSFRKATPMSLAHRFMVAAAKEPEHAPGDVWETDDGNWRAKNKKGEGKGGFATEDAAKAWVSGKAQDTKEDKGEDKDKAKETPEETIEKATDEDIDNAKKEQQRLELEDAINVRVEKERKKAEKSGEDFDEDALREKIHQKGLQYLISNMSLNDKENKENLTPENMEKVLDQHVREALEEISSDSEDQTQDSPTPKMDNRVQRVFPKGDPDDKPIRMQSSTQRLIAGVVGAAKNVLGDVVGSGSELLPDKSKDVITQWFEQAGTVEWNDFSEAYSKVIDNLVDRHLKGEVVNPDDLNKPLGNSIPEMAEAVAKARFLEKFEDIEDALEEDRKKAISKKLKALGPKIQGLIEGGSKDTGMSKEVQDALLDASLEFDDTQLERLSASMEGQLRRLKTYRPEAGEPWDKTTINLARKSISEGISGDTPDQIGESLANLLFSEKVVMNPEFVGNPAIRQNSEYGEGEPTSKKITSRAKASFRQYQTMSELDRVGASERIKSLLKKEKDPDSPRSLELGAVLAGIHLSQTLNGEKLTGTEHQPTSYFTELAKALNKKGDAELLLETMEDFTSDKSREIIENAIEGMSDQALANFAGGKDGPYGALAEALSDGSTLHWDQKRQVHSILSSLLTHRMTYGYSVIHDMYSAVSEKADNGETPKVDMEDFGSVFDEKMNQWNQKNRFDNDRYFDDDSILNVDVDSPDFDVDKWKKEIQQEMMGQQNQSLLDWADSIYGGRPPKGESPAYEYMAQAQRDQKFDNLSQKTDPPLRKTAMNNFQSSFNKSHHICNGEVYPVDNCGNSRSRRFLMARISKKGAKSVVAQLERVAELFQTEHETLGINEKAALDFAYRCDLLSDVIEKNAGFEKESLSEFDPVKEQGFNPEEIGKEDSGPLQKEPDEAYMNSQFSQQENRELRERQESGEIEKTKEGNPILDEQNPQSGKQALDQSLDTLTRMAQEEGSSVTQLSNMSDTMRLCLAKLQNIPSGPASDLAKKLSSSVQTHLTAFTKVRDGLIDTEALGVPLDVMKEAALGRLLRASGEVMPHLKELLSELRVGATSDSPTAQLNLQDLLDVKSGRIAKLMSLSAKIVSDAASDFGKKEVEVVEKKASEENAPEEKVASVVPPAVFGHGFDLYE